MAVYQVKSFSSNLTAGQKAQAERSFRRLLDSWRGLGFLEGLAGTYSSVIDYYLRDGKDRLQAALESITAVLRTSMRLGPAAPAAGSPVSSLAGPLRPAETAGTLTALHATLNEHDPHFSYDFSVDSARPEVPDQPGLVAAVQDGYAERWVTFKVFARYAEALVPPGNGPTPSQQPGTRVTALRHSP